MGMTRKLSSSSSSSSSPCSCSTTLEFWIKIVAFSGSSSVILPSIEAVYHRHEHGADSPAGPPAGPPARAKQCTEPDVCSSDLSVNCLYE
jgi:hypothetical protein